eukprot:203740_1
MYRLLNIFDAKQFNSKHPIAQKRVNCVQTNNKEETQTDKDKDAHAQNEEEKQSQTVNNNSKDKPKSIRNENGHQKVFKEKKQMQNVLNIIDKSQFVVNTQQRTEKENIIKTIYYVDLRREEEESKEDVDLRREEEESKEDVRMRMDANDNKENKQMDTDLNNNDTLKDMDSMMQVVDVGVTVEPLKKGDARKEDVIDAPHRDWSVLAKHLKDSSKEQARRKQILKQLERILHVREGLQLGFNQLKEIHDNSQMKQIPTK